MFKMGLSSTTYPHTYSPIYSAEHAGKGTEWLITGRYEGEIHTTPQFDSVVWRKLPPVCLLVLGWVF